MDKQPKQLRYSNAYESGRKDALRGSPSNNPYTEFSVLWGEYNKGFNSVPFTTQGPAWKVFSK